MKTKAELRDLTNDVLAALRDVCILHDVTVRDKGGSFTDNHLLLKLEFLFQDEAGEVVTVEAQAWELWAKVYDLEPAWLGQSFNYRGSTYKITGFNRKARKSPVQCERNDGAKFKFTVTGIQQVMRASDIRNHNTV